MKIEDEIQEYKEKKPKNNSTTIIAILIMVTLVIVVGIIFIILSLREQKMSVLIDGKKVEFIDNTFIFMEDTNEIYVSIKDVAPLVGYEAHNGEYKVNSEDTNKVYVEAKDRTETTSFFLNSTKISKVPPDSLEDYENIEITSPVTSINGKLYVSVEGFTQGFNSTFSYNRESNTINIQTLPYLVSYYKKNITNFGYDSLSEEFNNQKTLIYGMIVASKQTPKEANKRYGVINRTTGEEIISPRYNKIKFIENAQEFIITNASNKVGIAYSTGETKINVIYDDIKVLDSNLGYYLVNSNSKYGVINSNEELVIHIEYDSIGINAAKFPADRLKSQYILYDKIIPVCLNKKWGLFDIYGKKITEAEYDTIGCENDKVKNKVVNSVLTIGNSEVIVFSKDKLYGGISTKGDILLPFMFEYIYSITSGGETTYYIVYKAIDYINAKKQSLGYEIKEETPTPSNDNNVPEENNPDPDTNTENPDNEQTDNNQNNENQDNQNDTQQTEEDKQAEIVKSFNVMFNIYEGQRSRGSVRALIDTVESANMEYEHKVQIEYEGVVYLDNVSSLKEQLENNGYTVEILYNQESGFVEKIVIK